MSYILEALKKSQQERQIGHVPDISQMQDVPLPRPMPRWPRWLLAALLLNALILVVLAWRSWETHVSERMREASVAVTSPAANAVPETHIQTPNSPPAVALPSPGMPATLPEPVTSSAVQMPAEIPISEAAPLSEADIPPAITPDASVPEAAPEPQSELPPRWEDLPLEERTGLPAPRIDVHVFDQEPERRFVLIDLRKYRVGDALEGGATIEAITADGIVLSYGGRRYSVDRP